MKRIDMFCGSQASTAICLSMDQASCSSSNTIQLGGKTIDRHNPIINDSSRRTITTTTTSKSLDITTPSSSSSSQPPINPEKAKKISFSKQNGENISNAKKGLEDQKKKKSKKKKSVADTKVTENVVTNNNNNNNYYYHCYSSKPIDSILRRSSWIKQHGDLITTPPAGSTRCLLSDMALLDDHGLSSNYDHQVLAMNNVVDGDNNNNKKGQVVHHQDESNNNNSSSKPSSSALPKSGSSDQQEVVLRVSLHCKGCEGKLRKHLSRMQGVTSFKIDFAAKKVTVIGDVTPLSVLASISKVKNAQFWPESASAIGSGATETKKNNL